MKKELSISTILLFILGTLCLTSACHKTTPPATCVSNMADSAVVGQVLTFTSCTQGATSNLWNFGDGSTSVNATATHTYSAPGSYTVTFTPYNSAGAGTTKSFTIQVTAPSGQGGSITYRGITFNVTSCDTSSGTLTATAPNASNPNVSLVVSFFHNLLPATGGTYFVATAGNLTAANQLSLVLNGFQGGEFASTGGNGLQTAAVTFSAGKIAISGSGIELLNLAVNNNSDSSAFVFNIMQTQ